MKRNLESQYGNGSHNGTTSMHVGEAPAILLSAPSLVRQNSFSEEFFRETAVTERPWFRALEETAAAIRKVLRDTSNANNMRGVKLPSQDGEGPFQAPENVKRYLNMLQAKNVIESLRYAWKLVNEERNQLDEKQQHPSGGLTQTAKSWRHVICNRLKHTVSFLQHLAEYGIEKYETLMEEYRDRKKRIMSDQSLVTENEWLRYIQDWRSENGDEAERRQNNEVFLWPWAFVLAVIRWCILRAVHGEWRVLRQIRKLPEDYFFAGEVVKSRTYGAGKIVGFRWDLVEPRYVIKLKFALLYVPLCVAASVFERREASPPELKRMQPSEQGQTHHRQLKKHKTDENWVIEGVDLSFLQGKF
eukprot:gb/GECG01000900.1/.p1 GENE.gb/GECG01000900.1/~~gb/GECG01000900.1/.p1  ORF type:complete len:359 (+),score=46.52 gb/GECG01000900.1/:1-1077(+)